MSAPLRLALFAVTLAALFGVGTAAGSLLDPDSPGGEAPADAGHGAMEDEHGEEIDMVRGLGATGNGFALEVDDPERAAGAVQPLRFRILGEDGAAVTDFDVEHTKRMHLIVVRRDLTRFQHLHPRMSIDGTWEVPLKLSEPGTYRVFADFSSGGVVTTLASDVTVPGAAPEVPLAAPEPAAVSDGGYDVTLAGDEVTAGAAAHLEFEVSKGGRPVDVEPYLGADGHLVALRDGDLAFLHVHPLEEPDTRPGAIAFEATFPTAGAYRLFLQFQVDGEVETVAFTQEVE